VAIVLTIVLIKTSMLISLMVTSESGIPGLLIVIAINPKPERRAGLKPKTLAMTPIVKPVDAQRATPCGQVAPVLLTAIAIATSRAISRNVAIALY
jgi:hypothetical protein